MRPVEILSTLASSALAHPLLTLFFSLAIWAIKNWRFRSPSGPFELPILGALPFLLSHHGDILSGVLSQSRARNFKTWSVKWLGEKRFIMTTDPLNLQHVLKTRFENYPKGANFNTTLADLLGGGIFATDGPHWKRQRQLFSHIFSEASFRTTIMAAFIEHGEALDRVLARAADTGAPIDMQQLFHAFTLDSIAKIAFGLSLCTLEAPSQEALAFSKAFDAAQAIVEARFFTPGWRLLKPCLRRERALPAYLHTLRTFCDGVIADRRAAGDCEARTDVLSRAMALRDEDTGELLFGANDAALRDIILNFLIAGRDTTAQALSWAVLCVARSGSSVAEALAAEGAAVRSRGGSASPFSLPFEGVGRDLRYARSVTLETLRLFPSVPKDVKEAVSSDTLPDGSHVPAGALIAYLPFVMGRSKALWGEDAEDFRPNRFLPPNAPPSSWQLPAFNGAGPRACLGQPMALTEAAFILGLVYSRFELTLAPAEQAAPGGVPFLNSLTLPQARGVTMKVALRAAAQSLPLLSVVEAAAAATKVAEGGSTPDPAAPLSSR